MEMEKYHLRKSYDLDQVLAMAECSKADKNYDTYKERLKELIDEHVPNVEAFGYSVATIYEDEPVVFCMVSLGDYFDKVVAKAFETHEYLDGMMINALGDSVLFEATTHLYELLKESITNEGSYLSKRIEPGTGEADMPMQKTIFDQVVPAFNLDLRITEGFMLGPAKTVAYYYKVTDEDCSTGIDHDCSGCDSTQCKQRKFVMKIHKLNSTEVIQTKRGENLLEVLRQHKAFIDAPCNGMKSCGKCKIMAKGHGYELGEKEKLLLTDKEQADQTILACFHEIDRNLEIYLIEDTCNDEIETGYADFDVKRPKYDEAAYNGVGHPLGLGVDIGTTTLAVSLVNLVTMEVIDINKRINPQKAFGADIISRMMYVREHEQHELGQIIRGTIEEMSKELMTSSGLEIDDLASMVISGNTTMIYLLLDMDPALLAVAPFTTVDMGLKRCASETLFTDFIGMEVTILPWISAYVGGDIVSGLFGTHLIDQEATIVFVDIGTNGEIVLRTGDRLISAATAAGPAFEGANIRCGMGSIEGAICEIKPDEDAYDVETLGDTEPIGICGSALVDAVALLHKQGLINDMGFMENPVMFYENIGIYPEDVRQVQLAKAAIMAGVDVLLDEAGLTYDDIDAFYIAGGFGSHLNIENSAYIGLIPTEIIDKVKVVGNTSLAGSVRYLLEEDGRNEIEAIRSTCEYVELSTNVKFNDAYVMGMTFGDFEW